MADEFERRRRRSGDKLSLDTDMNHTALSPPSRTRRFLRFAPCSLRRLRRSAYGRSLTSGLQDAVRWKRRDEGCQKKRHTCGASNKGWMLARRARLIAGMGFAIA